jgi:hypothetical protein
VKRTPRVDEGTVCGIDLADGAQQRLEILTIDNEEVIAHATNAVRDSAVTQEPYN